MLLDITLKHDQVRASTTETQRVFTSGNFALDFASLVKLATNTSKQRPKSATDYVATHSSRHEKLAFVNLREIVDGTPRGIDTLINHMRGMLFSFTEHESKELFRQYCRPGGHLSKQYVKTTLPMSKWWCWRGGAAVVVSTWTLTTVVFAPPQCLACTKLWWPDASESNSRASAPPCSCPGDRGPPRPCACAQGPKKKTGPCTCLQGPKKL